MKVLGFWSLGVLGFRASLGFFLGGGGGVGGVGGCWWGLLGFRVLGFLGTFLGALGVWDCWGFRFGVRD